MAKPRVFVSSTYYDLKYVRTALEQFIISLGYEPILFEKGDIPFQHDKLLEEACLKEIEGADLLVLIIGGRYGSLSIEDREAIESDASAFFSKVRSITEKEYDAARVRDIPIFIFVANSVYSEYQTYKQNKENKSIQYAHVDDVKIFELMGSIVAQRRNNFIKPFEHVDEITAWLRDQWAGLFRESLRKQSELSKIEGIKSQVDQLAAVVKSIQAYSEELIKAAYKGDSSQIIERQREKILQRAQDEMIENVVIGYLQDNEKLGPRLKELTEGSRAEVFSALIKSNNVKGFLRSLGFSEAEIEDATMGVEIPLGRDFQRLKQALIDMIT